MHFIFGECLFVCARQVVCEKGLGVGGMTLTSLQQEGYKAVFIGIGECLSLEILRFLKPQCIEYSEKCLYLARTMQVVKLIFLKQL